MESKEKHEVLLTGQTTLKNFELLKLEDNRGVRYELRLNFKHEIRLNVATQIELNRVVAHTLTDEQVESVLGFKIIKKIKT